MVWKRWSESAGLELVAKRRKGGKAILGIKSNPFFVALRLCARYFSTPRAHNDYSTHVPILIGLAQIREIRHVLEFGCGRYSTFTFLNRAAFPDLERLHSVENDDSWAATIGETAGHDKRWTLTLVEGEIAHSITDLNLEAFDLILVDDSKTATERAATISTIGSKNPRRPWIVIHDYEVDEYRRAASGFRQRYSFKAFNPWTGLIWNSVTEARRVKALDRVLKNNGKLLEPDDAEAWITTFSATEVHE